MRYSIFIGTALLIGSLAASSGARGQVTLEAVPVVPNGITEPDRSNLARQYSELERRKTETEAGVAQLNAQCSRVDSQDSAKVADCRARNQQLRQAVADYRRQLASFISVVSMTSQISSASALPSGDPMVVDANVPSGLPKPVDNAIAGAYQNAPPGVSDRVRKGFQAVMERDWKVAKAWFEDALNRDPGNAGLRRLVELAGSTPQRNRVPLTAAPVSEPQLPSPDDVYYYIPSRGYARMTLEEALLREAVDTMMGVPAGSIINIR